MENTAVFGYGSLISPASAVQRCSDRMGRELQQYWELADDSDFTAVYRDFLTSDAARDIRQDDYDHIRFVPGRLDGFKRHYDTQFPDPDDPDGSQLSVDKDDDGWINGVVVTGLTADERALIDETESMYEPVQVSADAFEAYSPVPDDAVAELPDEITVYIRDPDHPQFDRDNPAAPMETYQGVVFDGFNALAQEYTDDAHAARQFASVMKNDFRGTTYWKDPDTGGWVTLLDSDPFA